MRTGIAAALHVLGGEGTLGRIRSARELRRQLREGLPRDALTALAARTGVRPGEMRRLLGLRRPRTSRFSPSESRALLRAGHTVALAEHVWESTGDARRFLLHAQASTAGERAISVSGSPAGRRRVRDLLLRLEYALPV
jgi:uncharacterized protein (DUF2384 family)